MPVPSETPRFSIVSAVYDVSAYLPEFIASIEGQQFPLDQVEVIMVDDGSTDGSAALLDEWQQRRPELVRVLHKPNGGQASARNLGLEHARGQWVTFTDPDDTLEPNALADVATFIAENPETELVALTRVLLYEKTNTIGRHPLFRHFGERNLLRNLDEHPDFFFGSAPAGFFRREVIEQHGLRFSEVIKPNFEDGFFCNLYLLRVPKPLVGFVSSAKYVYRKRADNSSTLNRSQLHPGRYTAAVEHGFLELLRESKRVRGHVPEYVQTHVLYELSYYFKDEEAEFSRQTVAVGDIAAEFLRLLGQIAPLLDARVVRSFRQRPMSTFAREMLLHGFSDEPWHTPYVVIDKFDPVQQTVRIVYRFTQRRPDERFLLYGAPVRPLHEKVRAPRYFEQSLVKERIVWLPAGTVRVRLDGEEVEVLTEEPAPPTLALGTVRIRRALDPRTIEQQRRKQVEAERKPLGDRAIARLARTRPVRRLFRKAWVLIDRIHDADDSAEHLFRYLRDNEPKINAWFVIERGTTDYKRLCKAGYRRRIVPHGTLAWKLLMLNSAHLISSHADLAVSRPPQITRLGVRKWRFTFLQHGVIKDDLSRWLNGKDADLFVVSTRGEYQSIAGDDTGYRYTSREVQLTGLPRFDRVREVGAKYPPERRDLLLVAPTWRTWLVAKQTPDNQRWDIDADEFRASDFAQNWLAVLLDERIRDLAKRKGLRIGLLLHPNLQAVAPALRLPSEIRTFGFEGTDVRELFARARVVVTDYSSMAFNAAYIDRPLVYFQFDEERMFSGGHVGRGGYFKYERDGFGPVTRTPDEAVAAILDAVEYGPEPRPEFLQRIVDAFPERDGRCSERVVAAIQQSSRKVDRQTVAVDAAEAATAAIAHDRVVDNVIANQGDAVTLEPDADPHEVEAKGVPEAG